MPEALPDSTARRDAVDPSRNVVLEASAGTGKTRVLVERYVNLLRAGVDPDHILAMTFTRKAAAEMRERIIERLREASRLSEIDQAAWRDLKHRLGDIAISTIDAFCLSLLREFPLEADVDPGFALADAAEVPRLAADSLDQSLRICRAVAVDDDDVALVFAQLGERRLRTGLAMLLDRRLVAPQALGRYLARGPRDLTAAVACRHAAERLCGVLAGAGRDLTLFLADGPISRPAFAMLAADITSLCLEGQAYEDRDAQAALRGLVDRLRAYFLTQDGRPRGGRFMGTGYAAGDCASEAAWKRHRAVAASLSPGIAEAIHAFRRDLNVVMSRGVWRVFAVALRQYQQTLDTHALLDFSGVLERALQLLREMDEFAQSRFSLESRYRHVLVDEVQDTSRTQWDLVAQLVRTWGEGFGASADALPPSIFIVGDRKQSIYGFRDAEVAVLDEAAVFIGSLRPADDPRRAISVSFRAAPELLAFANDVFEGIEKAPDRSDAFRYGPTDRFPVPIAEATGIVETAETAGAADPSTDSGLRRPAQMMFDLSEGLPEPPIGVVVTGDPLATADRVADEIVRLLAEATVRDRVSGVRRPAEPSDIAILFRSRESHRDFEAALERRGVSTYVYKGLGFFEADEVQDATALIRYLADPQSDLRAAAFLRSRLVRLSDAGLTLLAPRLAEAMTGAEPPAALAALGDEDRHVLVRVRRDVERWLAWVDRMAPSELLSAVLADSAYAFEWRGPGRRQARENLKKLGAMVRRFQNRGYATLARVAEHLEDLAVGDESNATIDAKDSVSLMTVHGAKGLEFPVVFVVNLARGTGGPRPPIRVGLDSDGEPSVAIADFQSEVDEDAQAKDREETKRLLYVALTRARDRLYLSASISDGGLRMGRGSLGEVLPQSLRDVLAAAVSPGLLTWTGVEGTHQLFAPPPSPVPRLFVQNRDVEERPDDFTPLS